MGKEKTKNKMATFKKMLKFFSPLKIIIILLVLVVILGGIVVKDNFFTKSEPVKLKLEDIGELSTQAAYVNEVNVTQDARSLFGIEIPFTQSKVIFSYNVVVKAGYDFTKIDCSVDEINKVIHVTLPEAEVLSCELNPDSFMSYHDAESIFTPFTVEKYNGAISDLTESAKEDAINNGLLEAAEENGKIIIRSFLYQVYDENVYTITFN